MIIRNRHLLTYLTPVARMFVYTGKFCIPWKTVSCKQVLFRAWTKCACHHAHFCV